MILKVVLVMTNYVNNNDACDGGGISCLQRDKNRSSTKTDRGLRHNHDTYSILRHTTLQLSTSHCMKPEYIRRQTTTVGTMLYIIAKI